jgi:hypothetical protein
MEAAMQSFTISGNAYFDTARQPVLLAAEDVVQYLNPAMDLFSRAHGQPLQPGEPVPQALANLETDSVTELVLDGCRCRVQVQALDAGILYTLYEQVEGGLKEHEVLRLCSGLRCSLGATMVEMEELFQSMVETEQLKLEGKFRPLLHQYCRMLRMVGSAELLGQDEDEMKRYWRPCMLNLSKLTEQLRLEVGPQTRLRGNKEERFVAEAEEGLFILGDERLLRQALLNLVANGLQHGKQVALSVQGTKRQVIITVKTLGGAAMDLSSLVEEPSSKEVFTSSSLQFGLQLCWKVFRLHGGNMAVSNHPDGVEVAAILPRLERSPRDGGEVMAEQPQLRFAGGIPDTLVELSDVLESEWYSTSEILD